jgi:aminopeptidase N
MFPMAVPSGRRQLRRTSLVSACLLFVAVSVNAQERAPTYTHADSLRGSVTSPARTWWDVTYYDLNVRIRPADSTIAGYDRISYKVVSQPREMQIDLQEPLTLDSVVQGGERLVVRRDGNAWFATPKSPQAVGSVQTVTAWYHGAPHVATRPPWDGGFTWAADSLGRPWVVTTDEGIGPSIWWPMKDTWSDETDSARVSLTLPDPLVQIGNGRLREVIPNDDGTTTWVWAVVSPINDYALNVASGHYAHYSEYFQGERGMLTADFYPLDYHLEAAKKQFPQALSMLRCFEHWFGPYPWYEDGYKLIEVPNTGMEHQSAVTYGNWYANGYRGRDASGTGLGMQWDFIIVHESAHEWFANSLTARDHADMWVHESFANYAEALYTECQSGKEAGERYVIGTRRGIRNDRPIVAAYGVHADGSGDMYPKGGNMLHTIRQIVGDDERWRGILRGLNSTFRHQVVTGAQVEAYISRQAGVDLSKVFDQYLRTTMVPTLEYRIRGKALSYRWTNVVPGFDMQVGARLSASGYTVIHPTERWQTATLDLPDPSSFGVDPNYYLQAREAK